MVSSLLGPLAGHAEILIELPPETLTHFLGFIHFPHYPAFCYIMMVKWLRFHSFPTFMCKFFCYFFCASEMEPLYHLLPSHCSLTISSFLSRILKLHQTVSITSFSIYTCFFQTYFPLCYFLY